MSLRLWLLAAMITSSTWASGAPVLYRKVDQSSEQAADTAQALREARAIAAQIQAGAGVNRLAALQDVLVDDRFTVRRNGATVFEVRPGPDAGSSCGRERH